MLNYKPEEDEDYEGVQDKVQDKMQDKLHYKLHYKLHDVRKVNNKNALQKRAYRIKSFGI